MQLSKSMFSCVYTPKLTLLSVYICMQDLEVFYCNPGILFKLDQFVLMLNDMIPSNIHHLHTCKLQFCASQY